MTTEELQAALNAVHSARAAQADAEHDLAVSVTVWLEFLDAANDATDNAFARVRMDAARAAAARDAVNVAIGAL